MGMRILFMLEAMLIMKWKKEKNPKKPENNLFSHLCEGSHLWPLLIWFIVYFPRKKWTNQVNYQEAIIGSDNSLAWEIKCIKLQMAKQLNWYCIYFAITCDYFLKRYQPFLSDFDTGSTNNASLIL